MNDPADSLITNVMAQALAIMLKEGEGVVVELPTFIEYPEEVGGMFVAYLLNGSIHIQDVDNVGCAEPLTHGRKIWYHEAPDQ